MIKVVLDTNVLISAIVFGGKPRFILELAIEGRLSLGISKPIIDEVKEVLEGKKFQFPPEIASSVISEIEAVSEYLMPDNVIDAVIADPDDNRILECAEEFNAEFIVSGDEDLLSMEKYGAIVIVSPSEFIEIYQGL